MTNYKKYMLLFVIVFMFLITVPIYAAVPVKPSTSIPVSTITQPVKNIWATFSYMVQLIAIGCVVFAGLRYMFASADQRADLKKGLGYLAIGAIIIFGAITIIQVVATIL